MPLALYVISVVFSALVSILTLYFVLILSSLQLGLLVHCKIPVKFYDGILAAGFQPITVIFTFRIVIL